MKKLNIECPFYVGQRVICVNNLSYLNVVHTTDKVLQKDKEYIVMGIRKSCCSWEIDIGISSIAKGHVCSFCKNSSVILDETWWFRANRFIPIEELFEHITYKAILEKEEKLIGVN